MKTSIILSTLLFLGSINVAFAGKTIDLSDKKTQECVAVELWTISGKSVNKGKINDSTVKIPEGWKVVGGSGGGGHPTIVICRDL